MIEISALDSQIVSRRLVTASRERVFRAFSDPATLALWWGPDGFTSSFEEFDFRPGGRWLLLMRAPDGTEYSLEKRFLAIAPPERIELRHIDPVHGFVMSMSFEAEGAATRVTWTMVFDSAEEADRVRSFILVANEENFDRLEACLAAAPEGISTAAGAP